MFSTSARRLPRFSFVRMATLTLEHSHVIFLQFVTVSKYSRSAVR